MASRSKTHMATSMSPSNVSEGKTGIRMIQIKHKHKRKRRLLYQKESALQSVSPKNKLKSKTSSFVSFLKDAS